MEAAKVLKDTDPANSNQTWHSMLRLHSNQILALAQQKKMSLNMMKLILNLFSELLKITDPTKERRYPPNEANPIVSDILLEACHLAYFMLVQATLTDHSSRIHLKSLDGLPWGKHHFHPTSVCLLIHYNLELFPACLKKLKSFLTGKQCQHAVFFFYNSLAELVLNIRAWNYTFKLPTFAS